MAVSLGFESGPRPTMDIKLELLLQGSEPPLPIDVVALSPIGAVSERLQPMAPFVAGYQLGVKTSFPEELCG